MDFTIAELDTIHLSLITREHKIRRDWIDDNDNMEEVKKYTDEAKTLRSLSNRVCAAMLSKKLGFHIEPLVESVS
jgi:hypothetical protein